MGAKKHRTFNHNQSPDPLVTFRRTPLPERKISTVTTQRNSSPVPRAESAHILTPLGYPPQHAAPSIGIDGSLFSVNRDDKASHWAS